MQNLMFNAWVKAQMAKQSIKDRLASEKGGADSVIIAVVIIIAVLAIGILFKDTIMGWFGSLTSKANDQISGI